MISITRPEMGQYIKLINLVIYQRCSDMMKTIEGYTYKINEHIGKGYSSTVHKGINDKTGQNVSIKVIEMAKLEDPINQMLLQHQITALKKLFFSSGVLHLYDVYATKNNTYIVTELCDGDLGTLLKKRKTFSYPEAVDIIKQIINGYLDVYNSGYLHRDIKPANIFYKGNSYKIGDFGFAIPKKQLDQHKNYNVGSPVYMPPQALKDNIYSVSCDTWAIGIIFYQLIKGVVPWRAISQQKLHQKILTQPLDQFTIGLPEIARNFLGRILHLDPKLRMSVDQMVNWSKNLGTVEIAGVPTCSPLRERKNQNIPNGPNNEIKILLTPKQLPSNPFKFNQTTQPPPTQKNINSNTKTDFFNRQVSFPNQMQYASNNQNVAKPPTVTPISLQNDEQLCSQTIAYSTNMINYLKFLHRLINFVQPPCTAEVSNLVNALSYHLLTQINIYYEYLKNPFLCMLDKWPQFLNSQKGTNFQGKLQKCKSKYSIFHQYNQNLTKDLTQQLIRDGITQIMNKLSENQEGNEKSIIAVDYLTTFYQLWHLKSKHNLKDFFKMSKIDLIVQGNPYNVCKDHLGQIKRKLVLIDIMV